MFRRGVPVTEHIDLERKRWIIPPSIFGRIGEFATLHFLRENGYKVDRYTNGVGSDAEYLASMKGSYKELQIDSQKARNEFRNKYYVTPNGEFDKELWNNYCSKEQVPTVLGRWISYKEYRETNIKRYVTRLEEVEAFLGKEKVEKFVEYVNGLSYRPDFVARKDDKIYIVEVKTNMARLHLEEQEKGLMRAKDYGFIPLIAKLKVSIETTDFEIEAL